MRFNASVSISASLVEEINIAELEKHFRKHEVVFKGFNFSIKENTKMANFSLNGTKPNLRMSIKNLYTYASQKVNGMETRPAKYVPDSVKSHLNVMQDKEKYERLYNYCADEYMKHCARNDQMPHPEVNEDFVF